MAFDPPTTTLLTAVLVIGASGVLAPALARAAAVKGVERLGPSVSISIQGSVYPLFAVVGATLFLGEIPPRTRIVGAILVAIGLWNLSRGRRATAVQQGAVRALPGSVAYPVAAGMTKGLADILRKRGLEMMPYATFGSFVGVTAALFAWLIAASASGPVRRRIIFGRGVAWFALGGTLAGAAVLAQFHALDRGDVSVVSPIVASQPLIVMLLSSLLLRGVDRITTRVVLAGAIIVAGTILVSL